MKGLLICLWRGCKWFLGFGPETPDIDNPEGRLLLAMRVTAKSRFNASVRLKNVSSFSFFTTTVLSLGLILLPLLQHADVSLAFTSKTLYMMQIFLAVSVLVYSVIISKAGYDVRSEKLNLCGNKIKELSRKMHHEMNLKSNPIDFGKYENEYNNLSQDSENHSRTDYLQTRLQLRREYNITGLKRLWMHCFFYAKSGSGMTIPALMIIFEIIFILDALYITNILSKYLN